MHDYKNNINQHSDSEESKGSGEDGEELKQGEFDQIDSKDFEKKRKKKTKEDIEKEALLMGDLYSILGLEDKKEEAKDSDIGKAYKKAALLFHPDKLGDKLTQKDKDVWLKI